MFASSCLERLDLIRIWQNARKTNKAAIKIRSFQAFIEHNISLYWQLIFSLQEGVADFGHTIQWCKSTPSYSLYLRVLSTSTLTMSFKYSFPSSQGSLTHSMVLERKATQSNSSNWCNVFQGHTHTSLCFFWRCLIHMLSRHLTSYKNLATSCTQHQQISTASYWGWIIPSYPSRHTWSLATCHETISKGVLFDARFVVISFGSQGLRWSCFRSVNLANLGFPVVKPLDPNKPIHGFLR